MIAPRTNIKHLGYLSITLIILTTLVVGALYERGLSQNKIASAYQVAPNNPPIDSNAQDIISLLNNFPNSNTSNEEKDKFFTEVRNAAKEAGVVDISDCKPNPPVLLIKKDAEFKFSNRDKIKRVITRDGKPYVIPEGQSITLNANTFDKTGVLGYRCLTDDGNDPVVGILYIID